MNENRHEQQMVAKNAKATAETVNRHSISHHPNWGFSDLPCRRSESRSPAPIATARTSHGTVNRDDVQVSAWAAAKRTTATTDADVVRTSIGTEVLSNPAKGSPGRGPRSFEIKRAPTAPSPSPIATTASAQGAIGGNWNWRNHADTFLTNWDPPK